MMKEILGVTDEPRTQRRWFHDEYFDLFVWQTSAGEITLFQLCYGIDSSERALVWHQHGGFFHDGLHSARSSEQVLGARLHPDTPLDADPIVARFEGAASTLPEDVREFVSARLREYAEQKPVPARRKRFRREDWQRKPAAKTAKNGKQQAS
jgi:hypothetical protein